MGDVGLYKGHKHTWDEAVFLKRADACLAPNHSGGEWRYWNMKQNCFVLKSWLLFLLVGCCCFPVLNP